MPELGTEKVSAAHHLACPASPLCIASAMPSCFAVKTDGGRSTRARTNEQTNRCMDRRCREELEPLSLQLRCAVCAMTPRLQLQTQGHHPTRHSNLSSCLQRTPLLPAAAPCLSSHVGKQATLLIVSDFGG